METKKTDKNKLKQRKAKNGRETKASVFAL